ncbi:hypothetical protein HDU96_003035 [Phlyctochytrium bullatum]|nr:hypothetical protein HDU96_003035 [Phlyctochytrium bullatum]
MAVLVSMTLMGIAAEGYRIKNLENQTELYAGTENGMFAGLIPVNSESGAFFWYVRSMKNDSQDLVLWINGGPGCSALLGLFLEHGPVTMLSSAVGLIRPNAFSWHRLANVVYLDHPLGTGMSYDMGVGTWNLTHISTELRQFLENFYTVFPETRGHRLILAGQGYAAVYLSYFADDLVTRPLDDGAYANVRAMMLGNPYIDRIEQGLVENDYRFLLNTGMISTNSTAMQDMKALAEVCQTATLANFTKCPHNCDTFSFAERYMGDVIREARGARPLSVAGALERAAKERADLLVFGSKNGEGEDFAAAAGVKTRRGEAGGRLRRRHEDTRSWWEYFFGNSGGGDGTGSGKNMVMGHGTSKGELGGDMKERDIDIMIRQLLRADPMEGNNCISIYNVDKGCGDMLPRLMELVRYLTSPAVREALHEYEYTPRGKDGKAWDVCSDKVRNDAMMNEREQYDRPIKVLPKIMGKGVPVIVYAGELDFLHHYVGIERAIARMKWNGAQGLTSHPSITPFVPWTVGSMESPTLLGYVAKARGLTYLRISKAGHVVGSDQPLSLFAVLSATLAEAKTVATYNGWEDSRARFDVSWFTKNWERWRKGIRKGEEV